MFFPPEDAVAADATAAWLREEEKEEADAGDDDPPLVPVSSMLFALRPADNQLGVESLEEEGGSNAIV